MCPKPDTCIPCRAMGYQAGSSIVLLTSSLSFQPDQDAMDNFNAVDLSWVKCTMDPLKVLRHRSGFLARSLQDQWQ